MVKNKTILGVLTLLLGLVLTASAENYPYRSDVLWVTVPNHAPGANPKARAAFSHQLKDTEGYEIESVLAGTDGWNPIANGNALVNIKR